MESFEKLMKARASASQPKIGQSKTISFNVTEEIWRILQRIARATQHTMSSILRDFIHANEGALHELADELEKIAPKERVSGPLPSGASRSYHRSDSPKISDLQEFVAEKKKGKK